METDKLQQLVIDALEDLKAEDIVVIDVKALTSITDTMIICSGNANRHVKAIANNVVKEAKHNGIQPLGTEGEQQAEWILVDLGNVIVHVMQVKTREFYQLEKLWNHSSDAQSESTSS